MRRFRRFSCCARICSSCSSRTALQIIGLVRGGLSGGNPDFDLWHALQHLKEELDRAFGDGTAEAVHRFEKLRETLKEDPDGIDKVLRSLRYLSRKHPCR